jgi:hypothetical protein
MRLICVSVGFLLTACASQSYTFRVDRAILHGSVQKHVRHSLEEVAGVKGLKFHPGDSTVTVHHDGTVSAAQVDRAIRTAGLWTGAIDAPAQDTWVARVRGQEY